MKKRVNPNFRVENFINNLGQTVKPGDTVAFVTIGRCHSVKVRKGIYLGVTNKHPTVEFLEKKEFYYTPEGKIVSWLHGYKKGIKLERQMGTCTARRTLQRDRVYALK